MKKAEFKTGNVGVEFIDEAKAARQDTEVLPAMVNAKLAANRHGDVYGKESESQQS
jgi:hypothetical protein